MPYFFEFEPVQSILRCTMAGPIDDKILLDCRKEAVRHVQQTDPAALVLDLTLISSLDVSTRTVQALARSDPAFPPTRPKFIVAPNDHVYGMSRMYQLIGEPIRPRLQVVRSPAEAYAALGIAELHFGPVPES